MAEGKGIEIKIAAIGGDQAAAEIRKVEGAVDGVTASEAALASKRAGFLTAAEAQVAEVERMVAAAQKLKAALPAVPFSQTGNVIESMTQGALKNGTAGVKNLGMTFTQVGYQVTDFTTQVSMGTSAFTAFAQQAPQAIAAMTQFGAAGASMSAVLSASVGVMMPLSLIVTELAIGIPMVVNAWKSMHAAQQDAKDSAKEAADAAAKLNEVLDFGADAYFGAAEAAAKLLEITEASTSAIDAEKSALEARNAVLDADAAAYKAKRDRQDAAQIRAGANPENVKIERANADEAEAIAKIEREQEVKRAGLREAKNAAVKAEAQVGITKVSPDATPELIAEAEKKAKDMADRAAKMETEIAQSDRIAGSQKTEVRERTAGTIEQLADERAKRQEKDAADKKRRDDLAEKKADSESNRQRRGAGSEGITTASLGMDAAKEAREMGNERGADQLERKARELMKNPSQDGSKRLMEMMESMLNWAENQTSDDKGASRIDALEKKLLILEARQKNSRNGK